MRFPHFHFPAGLRFVVAAFVLVFGECAGFACGDFAPAWPWFAYATVLIALAAWGWRVRHLAFPGLFLLGFLCALSTEACLRHVLDRAAGLLGTDEEIELEVESEPRETQKGRTRVVDFLSHAGPLPLKVVLPVKGGAVPQIGETWSLAARLARPRAEGRPYDRRTCSVRRANEPTVVTNRPRNRVTAAWTRLSEGLAGDIGLGLDWSPELADLNRAILLGRRADLPYERKRAFVDAGTIHVFAISGLHVMVVALLLMDFLAYFELSERVRALVALPLIVAYVILTGARPSAIRAAMMLGFCFLASMFGRQPNAFMAWGLTALIVYACHPERVYDLGCTLSFAVMLGIVCWIRWIRPFVKPQAPKTLKGRIHKFLYGLGVSFAAWLAGVPITAYAFGRFTPGGLLANAVVIFAANFTVKLGMSALVAMLLCFPLAALLNNAAAGFTALMTVVSEKVASLPFSSYEIAPWSVGACLVWYGAWILFFAWLGRVLPRATRQPRKWW